MMTNQSTKTTGHGESFVHRSGDSEKVKKNMTQMVILTSLLNTIAEMPSAFGYVIITAGVTSTILTDLMGIFSILIYIPPSFEIVIYYLFNKLYRKVLNGYVKNVFKLCF